MARHWIRRNGPSKQEAPKEPLTCSSCKRADVVVKPKRYIPAEGWIPQLCLSCLRRRQERARHERHLYIHSEPKQKWRPKLGN